eukprot:2205599-Rhodomonas_salina.2
METAPLKVVPASNTTWPPHSPPQLSERGWGSSERDAGEPGRCRERRRRRSRMRRKSGSRRRRRRKERRRRVKQDRA